MCWKVGNVMSKVVVWIEVWLPFEDTQDFCHMDTLSRPSRLPPEKGGSVLTRLQEARRIQSRGKKECGANDGDWDKLLEME